MPKGIRFDFDRFRGLMAERRYTNETLSKILDVSHVSVSNIRTGKTVPSIEMINKLIKVLRVDYDQLILEDK